MGEKGSPGRLLGGNIGLGRGMVWGVLWGILAQGVLVVGYWYNIEIKYVLFNTNI